MKIFLFHCWGGNSQSCWSSSIEDHFSSKSIEVINPNFPNTNEPILQDWIQRVRQKVRRFNPQDKWVLIGHSLGCPTILRLLESFNENEGVKAIVLVAGFAKDLGIPQISNFVEKDFNWEKIKSKANKIVIINSDNDPYIELNEGKRMALTLDAEFIVEHNAGHINEGSGFTKYERLVEIIEKISRE